MWINSISTSFGPGGEHSTTVAGEGRAPAYEHFTTLAEAFSISVKEMKTMVCEVSGAVERWPEFAEKAGVSVAKVRYITGFLPVST